MAGTGLDVDFKVPACVPEWVDEGFVIYLFSGMTGLGWVAASCRWMYYRCARHMGICLSATSHQPERPPPPPRPSILSSSFPQSMKILEKMAANKKKHEEAAARAERAAAAAQEEDSGDEGACCIVCLVSWGLAARARMPARERPLLHNGRSGLACQW